MKIKLNKEQVSYLNSLTDKEAKKEFLFDCFIESCEACLTEEPKEIIFKDGLFKTSDSYIASWLANSACTMMELNNNSSTQKSLSKDQLKDITNPNKAENIVLEYLGRTREEDQKRFSDDLKESLKHFDHIKIFSEIHPDEMHKYSKKDLEKAFNEGRKLSPLKGLFTHLKHSSFEDYFKTID